MAIEDTPVTSKVVVEVIDMTAVEIFQPKEGCRSFEDLGNDNGFRYWYASDLARCLGYEDFKSFRTGALNRAMAACGTLGIPMEENFVPFTREVDGGTFADFKLSRFACYLTAMNGSENKPRVVEARAYFAAVAASFSQYLQDANDMERLAIRDEITGKEKSLSGVANGAGVSAYALFQNAGYRGMYNMNLSQLKVYKGAADATKPLLDYMGKQELAANLFRLTETEAKIKNQAIRGQRQCEAAAESVGKDVRATMKRISGSTPEDLPLERDIAETRKNIKQAQKGFKKLDGKNSKKLPPK